MQRDQDFANLHIVKHKALSLLVIALVAMSGCAAVEPAPQALPADVGDASIGRAYAASVCATCHAIGPGEMISPDPRAQPFSAIATTPGMTRTALNAWLNSSHTNMPQFIVEPERVDDLSAYLATLRR
jgi:mono/diheme cytochrome c family protein